MSICNSLVLIAHIYSAHYNTDLDYNDQTPGVGVECRNDGYSFGAGYYNNSFNDPSLYATVGWNFIDSKYVLVGAVVGFATGYGEERTLSGCLSDDRCGSTTFKPSSELIPLAGIRAVAKLGRVELGVFGTPHLDDFNPGVLSFTAGWRFGQ